MSFASRPLLAEPVSEHSIALKLTNMRTALAAGADPNELDNIRSPRTIGRPLHYAICDNAFVHLERLKENLPVVKLLLEAGADPRLRGTLIEALPSFGRSPLEELRVWLSMFDEDRGKSWPEFERELEPFFRAAYREMKKVGDRLDGMFLSCHVLCLLSSLRNLQSKRLMLCVFDSAGRSSSEGRCS